MSTFSTFILISVFFLISVQSEKKVSETSDVFVPSKEWKTVKKGQPIPPGLHVRMNLQTGVTEAKLMDSDEEKPSKDSALIAISNGEEEEEDNIEEIEDFEVVQTAQHVDGVQTFSSQDGEQTVFANGKLTPQQLQEALQNLDFDDAELAMAEDVETLRENLRSIEELKEELAELELGMPTEAEEVAQRVEQFLQADDNSDKLTALNELEFILHHVDAARHLIQKDGIRLIIVPSLNSSIYSLQSASARLVAAAVQSNPTVQLAALEEGVLRLLLRQVTTGGRVSFDENQQKIKASVFAISCLVRNFPAAQRTLVDQGGLSVLAKLFDEANTEIKIKIITLLRDLVVEARETNHVKEHYVALGWHTKLIQYGWCERVSSLLSSSSSQLEAKKRESDTELPFSLEHDLVDKVLQTMLVLSPQCKAQFQSVLHIVRELSYSYEELAAREEISNDDDTFYSDLLQGIYKLISSLSLQEEL